MPSRKVVLANDEIYHVVNRGVNYQNIYEHKRDYKRALISIKFYQYDRLPLSLSHFLNLNKDEQQEIFKSIKKKSKKMVDIFAYCLMPNHFHLLVKQKIDNGISKYLSNFQNSYTKYFNLSKKRTGHLFQGQFKAVRIEIEEQFIHVARYIHLNPFTSYIVKDFEDLKKYPWSSLPEYLNISNYDICEKKELLAHFDTLKEFKKHIIDQQNYLEEINKIEHLTFEHS